MITSVEIPVTVNGMIASFDRSYLPVVGQLFIAKQTISRRIYGGIRNKSFERVVVDKSILQIYGNYCMVPLGALKFLTLNNPFYKFKFVSITPERSKVLNKFEVTDTLRNHPKFLLDGLPRDYFYDSLEACRMNPLGFIKLPTQSGKTSILLTLAHNLRKQVGTGAVFITSDNLRQQLLRRCIEYGIDNVILYEDYWKGQVKKCKIDKTQNWIIVMTPNLFSSRVKSKQIDPMIFKWMIYDECQHVSSPTSQMIMYTMQNLVRAYGFSATPTENPVPAGNLSFNKIEYTDALRVVTFGSILCERKIHEMITKGNNNKTVLINYEYRWDSEDFSTLALQVGQIKRENFNPGDYSHLLEMLNLNKKRMETISCIQSVLNNSGRNTVLNVTRRKYGFVLLNSLDRSDTVLWYGSNKVYENTGLMMALRDFDAKEFNPYKETTSDEYGNVYESKKLNTQTLNDYYGRQIRNIISTSSVGSEGVSFDVPINAAILSEGRGSNTILVNQRAGRTAGANSDKISIIINIVDKCGPTILNNHSRSRMTTLKKEYMTKEVTFYDLTSLEEYIYGIDSGKIKV